MSDEIFLVLGGGGMIGTQVVQQIAKHLAPRAIIVASLYQKEVRETIARYEKEFRHVHFIPFWGDIFVRSEWNTHDRRRRLTRRHLLEAQEWRDALHEDLFGDVNAAYERSQLVQLIREHRPNVVVDSINTATAVSYQDVYAASAVARQRIDALVEQLENGSDGEGVDAALGQTRKAFDVLLLSQAVPQLIRHSFLIYRAMEEVGTRLYVKVGTTGTGGMGLDIPYTHSEDKPSAQLMTKTAIAFAQTGLMFLMARTQGGPVVKEIKPGAMVGYTDITYRTIPDRGKFGGYGKKAMVYASREEPLGEELDLKQANSGYQKLGPLRLVIADTGENGLFAKGEFETITHMRQMEFITPEEIARQVRLEIDGRNTGHDVIAAIDGAVIDPTYRAGALRHVALDEMTWLENETDSHSVAVGNLGPPELGKLLWEAQLLRLCYGTLEAALQPCPDEAARALFAYVQDHDHVRQTITAIGLPVLTPDGESLVRGPFIRIPESKTRSRVPVSAERVDQWANKGWVDLRPANLRRWQERFRAMQRSASWRRGRGSASITRQAYLPDTIDIGAVVAWIFNNEQDEDGQSRYGYRIK